MFDCIMGLLVDKHHMPRETISSFAKLWAFGNTLINPEEETPDIPGSKSADGVDAVLDILGPQMVCFAVCPKPECQRYMVSLPQPRPTAEGIPKNPLELPKNGQWDQFAVDHPCCPYCESQLWKANYSHYVPAQRFWYTPLSAHMQILLTLPQYCNSLKNLTGLDGLATGSVAQRLASLGLFPTADNFRICPFSLSIDGVSPFEWKPNYSVWPFVASIVTLPKGQKEAFGATCLVGMLEGGSKPSDVLMQLLLQPQVDELMILQQG